MTIPRPCERVAVCYESTMRGYLELRVRSYDSKDPDVAELFASEHVYVREDVAAQREAAIQSEWVAFRDEVDGKLAAQVEINAALHDYSDEITVRICQMAEDLGLKSEPLEIGPDAAEVLSAIHDVLGERDALRRERDALRLRLCAGATVTP